MTPDLGVAALVICGGGVGLDLTIPGNHGGRQESKLADRTFLDGRQWHRSLTWLTCDRGVSLEGRSRSPILDRGVSQKMGLCEPATRTGYHHFKESIRATP